MIGHYLLVAARNVLRAGPFVLISIAGLAIGLGAALLMANAENDPDKELRRKAIFWLGQSKDPRAAELLLRLINK